MSTMKSSSAVEENIRNRLRKLNSKSPSSVTCNTPTNSKGGTSSRKRKIEWLSKDKLAEKHGLKEHIERKKHRRPKQKNNLQPQKQEETPQEKTSESKLEYEEYGLVLPSYKDILEQQKKYDEHKRAIAAFDEMEDVDLELPNFTEKVASQEESDIELLDCKDLRSEEIQQAFDDNLAYIKDIFNGKKYSARHTKYHNYKTENTARDLNYNTSMIVFTDDQKLQLMSLMENALDPDNKQTRYFFQVLLPELCLKIFMDVHNMSKRTATSYLQRRPIV